MSEEIQEQVKCPFCTHKNQEGSDYCNKCGGELHTVNPEEALGVKITDEDIQDYIILGFVKKIVRVGKVNVGIRTLKSGEWKKVNHAAEAMMAAAGNHITFTIEQNQRTCAYGMYMIGGNEKIGEFDGDKRYEFVQEMASDLVEIISSKIVLLHKIMMAKIQEGQVTNF